MSKVTIETATTPEDIEAVKQLFLEYLKFVEGYLGQGLEFQKTDEEFTTFPAFYDALYVAKINGTPVAACGLKPFRGSICELKRLYCQPTARGKGFGHALIKLCLDDAKNRHYTKIYLDTDHGLVHANAIYEAFGFKDIQRYYDNPMDSRFMGRDL
ncbi:MAG: GNAT family N-acetyltransferase [Maricaulaceae bacterium]